MVCLVEKINFIKYLLYRFFVKSPAVLCIILREDIALSKTLTRRFAFPEMSKYIPEGGLDPVTFQNVLDAANIKYYLAKVTWNCSLLGGCERQ